MDNYAENRGAREVRNAHNSVRTYFGGVSFLKVMVKLLNLNLILVYTFIHRKSEVVF